MIFELEERWEQEPRWREIERPYSAEDVIRLRGSIAVEYTLARRGAEKLWALLHSEPVIRALGAQTGAQAVQQVQAGLKSIYVSGWQVAGDMNTAGQPVSPSACPIGSLRSSPMPRRASEGCSTRSS
jgi:isocitrate lyase